MRANAIALAILLTVGFAAFLRAEPAQCADCYYSGMSCYNSSVCGKGCSCILVNGLGKAGVCE